MNDSAELVPLSRLQKYLRSTLGWTAQSIVVDKFSGGQSNPTFLVRVDNRELVLRRQPPGRLLPSAHAVDREYRVIEALSATTVPVPEAIVLCQDPDVLGADFYLMDYVAGQIYWDPALPRLDTARRHGIHLEMVRVLAAIHDVDIEASGLGDFGKPGNYFERQISRWTSQYRSAETESIDAMETLITKLPSCVPQDAQQSALIHGDFRLDNLIFGARDDTVKAVLDWELSTLGHPYADLAYLCMCMRLPREGMIKGLGGVSRSEIGLPEEAELLEHYAGLRGLGSIDQLNFYLAFSFFRLAAIVQGVRKRSLTGNASSKRADQVGRLAPMLAQLGAEALS